ncbi:MAG: DHA2 family efflux MFS transporter permease subunit [Thermoleophilia bacterium]|nr:DHA2 family efflux MFS transporter permease subunit [Thermoleophilia bacterium]
MSSPAQRAESASGPRSRLQAHPLYRWLVLVTVAGGLMMAILSSSIVNIALPTITTEFGSSITTMTWVVTIFMITQATLMPVWGRAGDLYGHKKIFITGLLIFSATSILCTVAWNPYSLIVGRALQAVGASALSPMALAFVFQAFPPRDRAQALGVMGGVMGAAPVIGLTGGGLLVEAFGWRSVFFIYIPLCAVIVPAALFVLRESEKQERTGFDILGGALLSIGLFSGLMGLNEGDNWGWSDGRTLACFALMAALLTSFVWWENRVARPMLDLTLLRIRSLATANIAAFFSSGAMFGSLILLPYFFQTVLGDSSSATGFEIAPLALMFVLVAPIGGRLTAKIGPRITASAGLVIAAAGFFLLAMQLSADVSNIKIATVIVVMGIGLGLTMAPLTTAAVHDAPADKRGIASSLPNMSRFIGGSFAIAIFGSLLASRITSRMVSAGVPVESMAGGSSSASSDGGLVAGGNPLVNQALALSFRDVFFFAITFIAVSFIVVQFIPRLKHEI